MSSVKKNIMYNLLYQVLVLIIPLITTPYVSRILGVFGVGEISYVSSVTSYFSLVALLGVSNYGNRNIAAKRDNKTDLSNEFSSIYFLQFGCSVLVLISYVIFIVIFADNKRMFIIYTMQLIASALDISWFYFGIEKFKLTVIRTTIVRVLSLLCIFAFVKERSDIYIYGVILTGSSLVSQLFLWSQLHKFAQAKIVKPRFILRHLKGMIVLFIPVLAVSLYKNMDKVMLGCMVSNIELGYYESCERISHIPNSVIAAISTVMLPRISNLVANKRDDLAHRYFDKSLFATVSIASSTSFGIMGIAENFVPWFFGEGYEKCVQIFQFLMPHVIFLSIASVIRTQFLIPYNRDNIYIVSVISGAAVNLIGNWILIPKYAASGAAVATCLAELTVCVIQVSSVIKYTNIAKSIVDVFSLVVFGIVMNRVVVVIPWIGSHFLTMCVRIIVGAIVYVSLGLLYVRLRYKHQFTPF